MDKSKISKKKKKLVAHKGVIKTIEEEDIQEEEEGISTNQMSSVSGVIDLGITKWTPEQSCQKKRSRNKIILSKMWEVKPSSFLMACESGKKTKIDIWYIDIGCSNHMSGCKEVFNTLDESYKATVKGTTPK